MSKKDDVAYSLQTLCHPASEFLADGQRLTLFIKRGNEAATEILRLRAENKKLRGEATHWRKNHDHKVEQLRIFKQREDLPVDRLPAYRRLVELQAEIEKLRAALKPFAITSTLMEGAGGDELFTISTYVKDFRAAAAALKETDNA